ncbi:MAG: S-methyl-5-thioribose-1-phosphate isomerase [Candidatus Altiarchaeota archaeon]
MKVRFSEGHREYKTVWMSNKTIFLIDQRKLPEKFEIYKSENHRKTALAIKNMIVRGAPAIGAVSAYSMAQAALEFQGENMKKFFEHLEKAKKVLISTRPTAFDLFHAVDEITEKIKKAKSVNEAKKVAIISSKKYAKKIEIACKKIGIFGNKLIKNGDKILTHCNAGALGCVDHGTALAVIREAHYSKKKIFVWVDETRPRLQGAKLTSWELINEGIPHAIIADNAAGYFMQKGEVDLCIVGADRIAINGDFANKIGTYEKAVLAKENSIPFYVAAPLTTFDKNCNSGKEIKIEERTDDEVLYLGKRRIAPKGAKARNPAFDITPKRFVTAFITNVGIFKPSEIKKKLVNVFT